MTDSTIQQDRPNGPAAAVLLAGGLGAAVLGLMTTLGESCKPIGDALNWYKPVGSLTGKTLTSVAVFFATWLILHFVYRERNVRFARVAIFALVLLGLGLLGTFPPFFEIFSGG